MGKTTQNYRPRRTEIGAGLQTVCGGYWDTRTSGDASLAAQQIAYANKCNALVGSVQTYDDATGVDTTQQSQLSLMSLASEYPMTTSTAQSYFPNVTPQYWQNTGQPDYLALFNAQVALQASWR